MELRDWLAGVAAAALVGVTPAAAQAPRSLFDALPAPAVAPVTTGLERAAPAEKPAAAPSAKAGLPTAAAKPASAARTATAPRPRMRPTLDAPPPGIGPTGTQSAEQARPAGLSERSRAKPGDRRRLASVDPAQQMPAPASPAAAPAQSGSVAAAAAVPAATPQKPMSRAERRRAEREAKKQAEAAAAAPPAQTPTFATNPFMTLFGAIAPQARGEALPPLAGRGQIDALVAHHAKLNNVPESLVHRVIVRESRYNPRAVGRGGAMGLMQIKTATARGVGYTGGPAGLLDAETNLTYAVKYLAGAWRVSGGSHDRAVSHYARGYYYAARRQGFAGRRGRAGPETTSAVAPQPPSLFSLFSRQAAAQ